MATAIKQHTGAWYSYHAPDAEDGEVFLLGLAARGVISFDLYRAGMYAPTSGEIYLLDRDIPVAQALTGNLGVTVALRSL